MTKIAIKTGLLFCASIMLAHAGTLNSATCKNAQVAVAGFTGTLNSQAVVKVNQPSGTMKLFKRKITSISWNLKDGSQASRALDPGSADTFSVAVSRPSWLTSVTISGTKYPLTCQ